MDRVMINRTAAPWLVAALVVGAACGKKTSDPAGAPSAAASASASPASSGPQKAPPANVEDVSATMKPTKVATLSERAKELAADAGKIYALVGAAVYSVPATGAPKLLIAVSPEQSLNASGGVVTVIGSAPGNMNSHDTCTWWQASSGDDAMHLKEGKFLGVAGTDKITYVLTASPKGYAVLSATPGSMEKNGPPKELATGPSAAQFGGIAFDDVNVYYAAYDMTEPNGFGEAKPTALFAVPRAGGAPKTLASDLRGPTFLAVDATNVYVRLDASDDNDQIVSIPKTGGKPTWLATGKLLIGLASDGKYVYFRDDKDLQRVPKAGGKAQVIAKGATAFAIDGASVLYAAESDHTIYKLAR